MFLGEKEVPSEVVKAFLVTSMISSDGDRERERKVLESRAPVLFLLLGCLLHFFSVELPPHRMILKNGCGREVTKTFRYIYELRRAPRTSPSENLRG